MTKRWLKFASISKVGVIALALLVTFWASGSSPSAAQQDGMHNCPQPGKWAISVSGGADGTDTSQALATCGEGAVDFAYSLDPGTNGWLGYFEGRLEASKLLTLDNMQGIIAHGAVGALAPTPTPEPTASPQESAMHNCPQPGKWAISVWSGADGTATGQALAACEPGTIDFAYSLDPGTNGWLGYFEGRPEVSKLLTLNNLQGIVAHGSAGFSLAVDKFGEGTVASSPGGIDCGSDCTNQAATYPSGTTVVLTPTADPGSTFSHWSGCDSVSGDSCTVAMDGDHTVFVTFAFSEVKIPETTKVLDAATMGYLIRQEGSTYYFDSQATAVASLKAGDVIVSGVGEGFIRKVTAVNATADEIAVATTDATLEDAVEQGTIILHQRLTPADVQSAQVLAPGASTSADMAAASLLDFNVDIDAELMPGVKAYGSASLSADLEIAVSFDGWDWGCLCFPVKEARAVLVTENATELGLSAKASLSLSKEKEIAKYDFAPIWVMVGSVPVGFFPDLSLTVGVEGHAGAKMESKVTLENTYAVGVRYRRGGGWSPVNDYSRDFDFTLPTLSAEAEAKAYIAPQLSVKVYGLVGPYFGLQGFLRLSAQPLQTPWWSLYGGIGASAGFEAGALGVGLGNYSWPVWSKEWLLAQADQTTPTVGAVHYDEGRCFSFDYPEGWHAYSRGPINSGRFLQLEDVLLTSELVSGDPFKIVGGRTWWDKWEWDKPSIEVVWLGAGRISQLHGPTEGEGASVLPASQFETIAADGTRVIVQVSEQLSNGRFYGWAAFDNGYTYFGIGAASANPVESLLQGIIQSLNVRCYVSPAIIAGLKAQLPAQVSEAVWISFADSTAKFFVAISQPPVDQNYAVAIEWLRSRGISDPEHMLSLVLFPVGDAVPETGGMAP